METLRIWNVTKERCREAGLKERAIGVTKPNTLRVRLLKTSLWGPHHTIMCLQMLYDLTFAMLGFDLGLGASLHEILLYPSFRMGMHTLCHCYCQYSTSFLISSKLRVCFDPLKNLRTSKQHC